MAVIQAGPGEEVLTLAEAAAFLRVPEDALLALAAEDAIPARKIGGEWRFLKRALTDWLRCGLGFSEQFQKHLHYWMLDDPLVEDLVAALEMRLLSKMATSEEKTPKPGSKQAVLKHFGIFREDDDLEARLAEARAQREAGG
jgi:excisionase family DNA binding protein